MLFVPIFRKECWTKRASVVDHNVRYVVADAESLPFEDASFDYVFSSLALQWCIDLSYPLREIRRILTANGKGCFSTLVDGSLRELRDSWAKLTHINT